MVKEGAYTDDYYNVSRYIPKKYHSLIDSIDMDADFDNRRNRTVHFYTAYFRDGRRVTGIGIDELVKNIKYEVQNV